MSTVTTTFDSGVLTLMLDRPEQGNAIDMALASDLFDAAVAAAGDPAVRCVVITGAGRMFCVGGDVSGFAAVGDEAAAFIKALADKLHEAVLVLANMAKPLVALVNGPAAGAGFSLAAAADIVLATETAHFTAAYTAIGLTPDGGMSWLLPRLVGLRTAQELVLVNRRLTAAEASQMGVVTRVVAADQLADEGRKLALQLADGPTRAFGAVRRLLAEAQTATLEQQLASESAAISSAAGGAEGREGVAAFTARRRPDFRSV